MKWFQKSLIFNFLFPNPTDELRYLIRNYKGSDEEPKLSFGSWNHFIFIFIAAYNKLVIFWPKQYCSTAVLESLAKLNFLSFPALNGWCSYINRLLIWTSYGVKPWSFFLHVTWQFSFSNSEIKLKQCLLVWKYAKVIILSIRPLHCQKHLPEVDYTMTPS